MKNFLRNPWTVGIGTSIIAGVLTTFLVDWVKKISLLSTIKYVSGFVWKCIISFLNYDVKVWWILIAIVILVFALWLFVKYNEAKEKNNQAPFLSYTQDFFRGQCWGWSWKKNWDGKYSIDCLQPICNRCKTPLVQDYDYLEKFKCPRCNTSIKCQLKDKRDVEVLIFDNTKKMYLTKEEK